MYLKIYILNEMFLIFRVLMKFSIIPSCNQTKKYARDSISFIKHIFNYISNEVNYRGNICCYCITVSRAISYYFFLRVRLFVRNLIIN